MDHKQEDYEDGKDTTPEQTMQTADNRFKNQKLKNKWNVPSDEEEKILSLQAEVKAMKRATKDGKKRNSRLGVKPPQTSSPIFQRIRQMIGQNVSGLHGL